MSDRNYNEAQGLRWSTLKTALVSGKALQHALVTPRADTTALGLGRAIHIATLTSDTPDLLPAEHLTASGAVSTSAKTRAWLAERGECYSPADWETAKRIAFEINLHPIARETLDLCEVREQPVYWTEVVDGVEIPCKACPDLYGKAGILADLKSHGRGALDDRGVVGAILRYGYAGQLAWYERGLLANGMPVLEWRLLFVESAAPHDVYVAQLGEDWQAFGREQAERALAVYASGTFDGVAPGLVRLELSAWLAETADSSDVDDLGLEGM
jgi:hypothetical protein